MRRDKVIELLAKLRALEQNAGTPEEAANAAAKMQDLIVKK